MVDEVLSGSDVRDKALRNDWAHNDARQAALAQLYYEAQRAREHLFALEARNQGRCPPLTSSCSLSVS